MKLQSVDIDLIKGELSKRSLKAFITTFWPILEPTTKFIDNWHIDCFCDHLTAIDQIQNLLINLPPGTTKSLTFKVFFPCWKWLHQPAKRFLCGSYAKDVAIEHNELCRKLIASDLYQKCFGPTFKIEEDRKERFSNDQSGYMQVTSVGGTTTGLKCNYAILDDPHNASESNSPVQLQNAIDWFTGSFMNRTNNLHEDSVIVVGQRIARNDLSGYIQENYKDTWVNVCLPLEYRPALAQVPNKIGWKDPRTEEGESLCPARFPEKKIKDYKKRPREYNCQFQQNPIDSENALFKPENFRYYDETADSYKLGDRTVSKGNSYRLVACDVAASEKTTADYTAIIVADILSSGDVVLVHAIRERISPTRIISTLQSINEMYRPSYFLVEENGMGIMVREQARGDGLAVRGVRARENKEARSVPLQVRSEANQLWFPRDRAWVRLLETELCEFPNGAHDDLADSLFWVGIESQKANRRRPGPEEAPPPKSYAQIMNEAIMQGL